MTLGPGLAWATALPLLLLVAAAIGLPFVWRGGAVLWTCVQGLAGGVGAAGSCAAHDLVSDRYYLQALLNTLGLSLASTAIALVLGLGAAIALAGLAPLRRPAMVLVNLGANFAGVPLALALTLLFGSQGILSSLATRVGLPLPVDLQGLGGLLLAYVAFQAPLATLMLMSPVQMLDAALPEAAATLGASPHRYWARVGLPLLLPSLVEVASLLFANAAAAYATPFALSGTAANVLAVRIAALVSGDIFAQPELSSLLALVLFALLVAVIGGARWWAARLRREVA